MSPEFGSLRLPPTSRRHSGRSVSNRTCRRADEHVEALVEPDDLDVVAPTRLPGLAARAGSGWYGPTRRAAFPWPRRSPRSRSPATWPARRRCPRRRRSAPPRPPGPSKARCNMASRISRPRPRPWWARPSQDPLSTERTARKCSASMSCMPMGSPSTNAAPVNVQLSADQLARCLQSHCAVVPRPLRRLEVGPRHEERHGPGVVDAPVGQVDERARTRPRGGDASSRRGVRTTRPNRGQKVRRPSPGTPQPPGW